MTAARTARPRSLLLALACILAAPSGPLVLAMPQRAGPASPAINLRNTFGLLQSVASRNSSLPKEEWTTLLTKEGLRADAGQGMWRLRNADGELRIQRFDLSDGLVVYNLLFFPSVREPIPAPMLDWMLKNSRYVHLDEGDKFAIGLPRLKLEEGSERPGTVETELTVYLPGGGLSRTVVTITWPPVPR